MQTNQEIVEELRAAGGCIRQPVSPAPRERKETLWKKLTPQLIHSLKHYTPAGLGTRSDRPGSLWLSLPCRCPSPWPLASGVAPEQDSTLPLPPFCDLRSGGSKVPDCRPTAAFATIVAGIVARSGMEGLAAATILAGRHADCDRGVLRMGSMIKFITLYHYTPASRRHRRDHPHRPAEGLFRPDLCERPGGDYGEAGRVVRPSPR